MPEVIYEKRGRIAYITLNRPEKRNAINPKITVGMAKAWQDFAADDSLWVVILTGTGDVFSSGLDISELPGGNPAASWVDPTRDLIMASPNYWEIMKPTIAALNGPAMAAGWYLASECDIRIASETFKMSLPEVRWGLPSDHAINLSRLIPFGLAAQLLYTGDMIDVKRAYEIGLVNEVVPKEEVVTTATAMAERICDNAPIAVRCTKKLLRRSLYPMVNEIWDFYQKCVYGEVWPSEDAKEGPKAFAEKRKPDYKNK